MPDSARPAALLTAALTEALESLAALRGKPWIVTPLDGGITNRNFRLDAGGESFVLRVAGAGTELLGIDRQREHRCAQVAAASGAGSEVIAFFPEHGAMLTRYAPGAPLAPRGTEQPAVLARAVRALVRFHDAAAVPGRFCPFRTVERYLQTARQHGVAVPAQADAVVTCLVEVESAVAADEALCPCHNDLLPGNLIDDGKHIRIIDWEYAAMGDRFFDLANLAENHEMSAAAEVNLLEQYFGEARPGDLARLRTMRAASAMREAAWGFVQAGVSTLDFDFDSYARSHLARAAERIGTSPPSTHSTPQQEEQP